MRTFPTGIGILLIVASVYLNVINAQNQAFPFAINTDSGDEILLNAQTPPQQTILETDFINSAIGSSVNNKFSVEVYPTDSYSIFQGLDDTSMFASSVSIGSTYAVVGANGYDAFNGAVYVYSGTGGRWVLQSIIRSPDSFNSNFGLNAILDEPNKNIMISANAQDAFTGRVYVYSLNSNGVWIRTATIASPLGTFQSFGYDIDISGNYAVIGTANGYAFIYEKSNDVWQVVKTAQSTPASNFFGRAVAIDGEFAVIGAPGYDDTRGAVYIYRRIGSANWIVYATLTSVTGYNSQFGFSVAIHNSTIAIGAPGYRPNIFQSGGGPSANNTGWVYCYEYNHVSQTWSLNQSIASPVGDNSYFGISVQLSKYRLGIGADGYPNGNNTGLGYLYSRTGPHEEWQPNLLFPSPAGYQGHFGASLDVSDDYAAIGAYAYDDLRGSIYFAALPFLYAPTASPTQQPAALNSDNTARVIGNLTAGVVAAIFISGFACVGLMAMVMYCCCCRAAPIVLAKKKKKEEEESPYTVHSYMGYNEMGVPAPPVPRPSTFPFMMPGPMMPPPPPPMDKKDMMKDDKKNIIDRADPGFIRRMFPYKVYSYRGYKEGDDGHEDPNAVKKEDGEVNGEGGDDGKGGPPYGDETFYQGGVMDHPLANNNNHPMAYNNAYNTAYNTAYNAGGGGMQMRQPMMYPPYPPPPPGGVAYDPNYWNYPPQYPPYPPNNNSTYTIEEGEEDQEENSNEEEEGEEGPYKSMNTITSTVEKAGEEVSSEESKPSSTGENYVARAQAKYAQYLAKAKGTSSQSSSSSSIPKLRSKQSSNLTTPSIELDVALTEPMKLLALQETKKNEKSESIDPEARTDLAQQDELDRLRSVEAARARTLMPDDANASFSSNVDDEVERSNEMNRLMEEEKLRNEERIRARFALFRNKAEGKSFNSNNSDTSK